ncbi:hypothetical protein CYY_002033 [Polysphondylium violaceum]|uniref:Transglutaminase-like domain-containing protein n=1 Tax=Polysphondylium violaceum TaxID=133409 RepID=A0A8J4V3A1_9MYCE|nr:hypothetical protein CYY_002033 [Polysphondylium violaceum]
MENTIIEFKNNPTVRIGCTNKYTRCNYFIGVNSNGVLRFDQDLQKRYEWNIVLSKDTFFLKTIIAETSYYLCVNQHCKVVLSQIQDNTCKLKALWSPDGKICLMANSLSRIENNTVHGPLIGYDKDGFLVANTGDRNDIHTQWTIYPSRFFSQPSTQARYLSDVNKHIEMWNGNFKLIRQPTKQYKGELTTLFAYPTSTQVKTWAIVMSAPPTPISSQTVCAVSFNAYDYTGSTELAPGTMIKAGSHFIFKTIVANGPESSKQKVVSKFVIEAQLFSCKLTKVGQIDAPAPPLQQHVKVYHLRETPLVNFSDPQFREWLNTYNLHPRLLFDGTYEPALAFAYRVLLFIKVHFVYHFPVVTGKRVIDTISTRHTDCGGFVRLCTAIFRCHGIPARGLYGRWAKSGHDKSPQFQFHVKGEFFIGNVGWVPYDPALALGDSSEPFTKHFGYNSGEFFTMHIDDNITDIETSIISSTRTTEALQSPSFWATGQGEFKNSTLDSNWVVIEK